MRSQRTVGVESIHSLLVQSGWLGQPVRIELCGMIILLRLIPNEAEHSVLYQYNLVGAQNHYMGLIQTETVILALFRGKGSW